MAQRYGGKFSPDESGPSGDQDRPAFHGAQVDPVGARSNVLFLPPVVLAFTSLTSGATLLAVGLTGAAALALGAWMLRDGLRAEAQYTARRIARRPALPRKIGAALFAGLGTALAAWTSEPGVIAPLIYGVAAGALHIGAFGIDPLRDKGMEGIDTFQQDRVARVVDEAESYLTAMSEAARRAADRQVESRVERFQTKARELIRTVEEDPRDLTAARKFLVVYLMGARDASVKFADIYSRTRDTGARSDFMMLLTDLEESFGQKTKALLLDNNSDLTVEIEVLRDRLQREGVRLDP
ncbi:5-bromo-4-chloroindolyl phosphate hydrolysis family protein [Puniceibacterium sp. IMCC21224]|uniref:5-bromo-4-chloroindolyl phosphate hydrolysis family protein n=1 Tax=Puniceibacterium sp. IMCC21224 TaxID=1618204 RepID=UPI00064E0477|nr:5-bromo-4-chloroindolyl phosphate hydrolysis family protein [Puniceibacterium sp. IMCC21224]KMK66749.1 5-bromo-4-chloroindolyl phosphate hydrolysis protein [Puniceibacterium sp. IMCC21224]